MSNRRNNDKTQAYKIKTAKVSNKRVNSKNENKTGKKKHPKLKKFIIICFIIFILLCLVGVEVFEGIFFSDKWKIDKDDLAIALHNTTVYDKDGKLLSKKKEANSYYKGHEAIIAVGTMKVEQAPEAQPEATPATPETTIPAEPTTTQQ